MPQQERNDSLDALRGWAILAMVLSGSIAFGGALPAWMYHAQVPPPLHKFDGSIAGITWVDLVFPFFLFAMGAAIPLALNKSIQEKVSFLTVAFFAAKRYVLLVFFALFFHHMKAWVIADTPGVKEQLLSILGFVLLFFMFYKDARKRRVFIAFKVLAFVLAAALLYILPFSSGQGFLLHKSDIIIIVLANMAFFGTILWWLTKDNPWLRIGLLPFIMAVYLAGKEGGSWNEMLFDFSPLPWMYKFYYLKYLFIIVPGTFAGEWMLSHRQPKPSLVNKPASALTGFFSLLIIITNLIGLFERYLFLNLLSTVACLMLVWWFAKKENNPLYIQFIKAGAYLLVLGLAFEAYEGGIKKDSSTYSYYFVCSGLAFFTLVVFGCLQQSSFGKRITGLLAMNGQNPMVAYVAGALLVTPFLSLTQLQPWLDQLNSNAWAGFLKGLIFTTVVCLITVFTTRKKWFWKT